MKTHIPLTNSVLARAHRPSHSMRFKHRDRRAHGLAEGTHPKVQTEASDRSLSRHVSHPRKRAQVKVPTLLLFTAGAAGFACGVLGSTCLSAASIHGRSCPAHLLELLGSAAHSEVSNILRCVRARHDRAHIDDLSNIA